MGVGKPLPSTPSGSAASLPASPTKKRATDLIKFFEHASSPSADKLSRGHVRGASDHLPIRAAATSTRTHTRAISVPDLDEPFAFPDPPALERVASEIDTLVHPHDSASEVAARPARIHVPEPVVPAVSARKRDASPLRNVRNVVAAWRGTVPAPQPMAFDTPALRLGTAEGEEKAGKRGNVFEEAFFTIRRMSTRRRGKGVEEVKGEERREEKPLPAIVGYPEEREVEGRKDVAPGNLVSAVTEMTTEVRPFSFFKAP